MILKSGKRVDIIYHTFSSGAVVIDDEIVFSTVDGNIAAPIWVTPNPFGENLPTAQTIIKQGPTPIPSTTSQPLLFDSSSEPVKPVIIITLNDNIDIFNLVVDVVGILADGILFAFPDGPGEIAEVIGGIAELAGAINTLNDVSKGNLSGVQGTSRNEMIRIISENPILIARFGRMTPILGLAGNIYSLYENLDPKVTISKK